MRQGVWYSILLLGFAASVGATPQTPDMLFWNGERHHLVTYPLEGFFRSNPDKRPQSDISSTGLYRGYIATWAIVEDQLHLLDLEVLVSVHGSGRASVFAETFPEQDVVVASWFTGELVLNNTDHDVHYTGGARGNTDRHTDEWIVLRVEQGMLTSGVHHSRQYKTWRTKERSRPLDLEFERAKAEIKALVERIDANTYLPGEFRNIFLYPQILERYQAIIVETKE